MNTFAQAGIFLIQAIGGIYLFIVLLRLLLPLVRADFYNPLSQFVVKATQYPLIPLRKLLPTVGRFDLACFVLAVVLQLLIYMLIISMQGIAITHIGALLLLSIVALVDRLLDIYFFGIIVLIIISWVAPHSHHPALSLVRQIIEPFMAPFRRLLPPMGGLDLSPMLAVIAIYVLRIFLSAFQQWLVGG